jgi:3-deoxy-D-manno-octulosonic-acid transferase
MNLLYSALLGLVFLLTLPWWALQAALRGKYRAGFLERLGRVPLRIGQVTGQEVVWIHAVSVGEVLAIASVAERLRQLRPGMRVLISTTTATGQKLARQRFGAENAFYFPLDWTFCIRPYLRALQPRLVVLAETEFWPNFLRLANNSGAKIAVINARISDRSFPRYRRWKNLLTRVLENVDLFCAQAEEDARRLREIGAPSERVQVAGNLKFDATPPASVAMVEQVRIAIQQGGAGPVIVCGSTVPGEDEQLVSDFAVFFRGRAAPMLLLLAPRHPERFEAVAALVKSRELPLVRRSEWKGQALSGGVFLLDSIGELASVYQLADVAFVGGSMAPRGGHNILEPAYFSKAICIGPHTENFRDIVDQFIRAGAVMVLPEGAVGFVQLFELAFDREQLVRLGTRARAVLNQNSGATERTLRMLSGLLPQNACAESGR